jgi:hypothetical protein
MAIRDVDAGHGGEGTPSVVCSQDPLAGSARLFGRAAAYGAAYAIQRFYVNEQAWYEMKQGGCSCSRLSV